MKAQLASEATRLASESAEAQTNLPEQAFRDWPAAERAQVRALLQTRAQTAN